MPWDAHVGWEASTTVIDDEAPLRVEYRGMHSTSRPRSRQQHGQGLIAQRYGMY